MSVNQREFLQSAFRWYYFNRQAEIKIPTRFREREFGFRDFDGNMKRHISIAEERELTALIIQTIPRSIYSSSSYYRFPAAPMDQKGWIEGDLIFDLDLKEVNARCKAKHDFWICDDCKLVGRLPPPLTCSRCGSKRISKVEWICDECLGKIKGQTVSLIQMLHDDFGIRHDELSAYFSGNHGYHISVSSTLYSSLSSRERTEIVDYIRLNGFTGSGQRAPSSALAIKVDPSVSMDVHRIFRLPGSLHDKSGLSKKECDEQLSGDPFDSAVALREDPVKIRITYAPQIRLKGQVFGPYKDESKTIPTYAAVYLMLKGLAVVEAT
ncbi:MAG: hypothetical protein JRM78_03320 [Nitrososphaerota archaeon]|nr:hypothetical protein [Nitrososphaerota archaeon]